MNFKTHRDTYINTNLTTLQGFVEDVPFWELCQIFGEPITDRMDDRVTCYWDIQFQDGTICSLDNYRMGNLRDWKNQKHWKVHGYRRKALGRVREAIAIYRESRKVA